MEKKFNDIRDEWYKKAKNDIHTPEQLKEFADEICEYVNNSKEMYNDSSNGAAAISLAAMHMMAFIYGMTSFQMGWVMWQLIDQMVIGEHDCGMKLVNYNDMLYPQYEDHFMKTLPKDVWERLQQKAKDDLKKDDAASEVYKMCHRVREHIQSIAYGNPPFGYKVLDK